MLSSIKKAGGKIKGVATATKKEWNDSSVFTKVAITAAVLFVGFIVVDKAREYAVYKDVDDISFAGLDSDLLTMDINVGEV